jgi:hypothetical protein
MKYFLILLGFTLLGTQKPKVDGAWESRQGDDLFTMIIADDYMVATRFNIKDKKFYATHGGTITSYDGGIKGVTEFNSAMNTEVGKAYSLLIGWDGDKMQASNNGSTIAFTRLDDGIKGLAGNWRITQREQNGKLTPIHTTGPRKTIKMLSSTRFQWAAINTETGEFFGTGGGRYSFEKGKYTEMIEFFSRDSSRVGMSLSFDGRLAGKDWYHSGKSSRGDPINEVWSRN